MKGALSSFELRHVVSELQFLIGAKIEKVFQQAKPNDDFLFVLHVPSKGKQLLYLSLPEFLCLSSFKPIFPEVPPGFCAGLRRKITNGHITDVSQHHFERIIMIGISTKHGPSKLIIEFISPGNIILVDESDKILSVLHPKIWSEERKLLSGKQYVFPPEQLDPATLSLPQFQELVQTSTKESIVKSLAIDCSLGGVYAEEVVKRAGVEKNKHPAEVSAIDAQKLHSALHELFAQETKSFIFNEEAFPIALMDLKNELLPQPSFNEAIAHLALAGLTRQEEVDANKDASAQLSKTENIILKQKQMLEGLKIKEKENQAKGELIYNHYAEIKIILDKINELRKLTPWSEIKEMCADIELIDSIDENTGTIYVNME